MACLLARLGARSCIVRTLLGQFRDKNGNMADAPKLKDFFTADVVRGIGQRVARYAHTFDVDRYVDRVLVPVSEAPFTELEFTARSRRIADAIVETADLPPIDLLGLLTRTLPNELVGYEGVLNDGFDLWPYGDIIGRLGVDHPNEALAACYELTKRFTSEFAIRPILASHPHLLEQVATWVDDPNEHVRRLVSEGTRPRLPWAPRLQVPLDDVLAILTALRADESAYVRKSVANHLNDLSKEHPDRVIALLGEWHAEAVERGIEETVWVVRHALRNQLKDGTPSALAIFGYSPPEVDVVDLAVEPATVAIGDRVAASFTLRSTSSVEQKLMVDLVMGYVKANGSTSPKVFKYRELMLAPTADEVCEKSFDMVVRSTRRLYPGVHTIAVRVNGEDLASCSFELS